MKHFVLLLFAGDYRDANQRRREGLSDRYRHHTYALESLERVVAAGSRVTVVQVHAASAYDEQDPGGIRFVGLGPGPVEERHATIVGLIHDGAVSHVMLRFPSIVLLRRLVALPVRVSVVLADSFPSRLRNIKQYRRLGALLGHPRVDFVSNHHLNSSRQVGSVLGVDQRRIVPWDWPLDLSSLARSSAKTRSADDVLTLSFVGSINGAKGVWDLLAAARLLRERGQDVRLEIAGAGQLEQMWSLVDRYDLRDRVTYHGRVGGDDVVAMMRRSDFVCVPSHHAYPEGLPLTLYEAMASGTPLIASDHPMFAGVVRDGETGFVFRAGRPARLAQTVTRAWRDEAAYGRVSAAAAAAYDSVGLTTLWGEVALRWVRGMPEDLRWLDDRSLAALSSAR